MPKLSRPAEAALAHPDRFEDRHIGPSPDEIAAMLKVVGFATLDELMNAVVPADIRLKTELNLPAAASETEALEQLRTTAARNKVYRSFIGMGYYGTVTPAVIQRNILENPGWYTQYTPYQAEIAQGRLEALLNFQTMIIDLTGMDIANASMLDEGTAAAEAMALAFNSCSDEAKKVFFVARDCHPQTIAAVRTRAWPLGISIEVGDPASIDFGSRVFGALLQYPGSDGSIRDYESFCARAHAAGALVTVAADPLALTLLRSPGEFGADIAVGSTQRFGVPLGFGGPHAAYFATKDEHKRLMPGRLVGVSKDADGKPALRLALQTREQHIRREKATSNICTAQVLLAVMASMYAVYHGPEGLRAIAERLRRMTLALRAGLRKLGFDAGSGPAFDTLRIPVSGDQRADILKRCQELEINLRDEKDWLGVSLDETTSEADLADLLRAFGGAAADNLDPKALAESAAEALPKPLGRQDSYLEHPVFHKNRSETEMLRYMYRLQSRDLSLTYSMIPLGSCTMKLNATSEMLPVTWRKFNLHPFAPAEQTEGYSVMLRELERWLAEITGFSAVSLQPNAGSQGEYAGLLAIRKYHETRGDSKRSVCLIPQSAHGTNPASAAMAGLDIVVVACDSQGNVDLEDLRKKADEHREKLGALMITYPSTHGVFETTVREICKIIHERGGLVYLDGANLNAQVGYCRPGDYGADVCHLNLHKTFCIPHGGGGPGMGPIAVTEKLKPFLPGSSVTGLGGKDSVGSVSAAPYGSASILPITWMYIRMMGPAGLKKATAVAVLNANYIAARLSKLYPVLYKGSSGLVAHECILDMRPLKAEADVAVEDVAKRLMDHGYHAPTVSWPVSGTVMIEPTESESKEEIDIFLTAMTAIRKEADRIRDGQLDRKDNPLKNAPHTAAHVAADQWKHPYGREEAAYPSPWTREFKFWPPVARVDAPYGDRNLVCTCPPVSSYTDA